MRTPKRAALRLALAGWLGLAGMSLVAVQGQTVAPPEKSLPDSTFGFLKVNNAAALREAFRSTQFGQLWNDPALKDWRDDLKTRLSDAGTSLKKRVGVTYQELLELPQGPVTIALVRKDDPKLPISVLISADAGKNANTMADVLGKATKQGEESGAKLSTSDFKGTTLHVIQPPKREKKEDAKDDDTPEPPVVWTQQGTVFYIGSDVDAVKDLLANTSGRDNSLAANESYDKTLKKLGPDGQVTWFIDLSKVLNLVLQARPSKGDANQAQQTELIVQTTGLKGLKAAAGSFVLNSGSFDSISKTVVLTSGPAQGLLKIFKLPPVSLRPEAWVPATVASYQSFSWDLDAAFTAINDLANTIQPGMLDVVEQQLVGPNGGPALSFQKDLFGPLGDRITLISDFKKPIKEENQRMLVGVALEDTKAFTSTLSKLIELSGAAPKTRDFQGTKIYDFDLPEIPNQPGAPNVGQLKGPISVAIAKDTLFLSLEPTLLEQVLRGGGQSLADSPSFQAVAKEIPKAVSTLNYVKPEEQAKLSYDMIKSGNFQNALQGAAAAGAPDLARLFEVLNKDKLPDFSVFAKYLSQGGGYSIQTEDGLSSFTFTLRKANP
ncbi:hypothetical protein [Singulisphaera sp. PoT]|uniref:hypothetical protein n=1 Tax=Singulisphaera sp. PoT TaxID=3411797 RepID=UPI003BF5CBF8